MPRFQRRPAILRSESAWLSGGFRSVKVKPEQENGLTNGDGSGKINKNIPKMSPSQIRKSIRSWEEGIRLHRDKIANPAAHYPDWDSFNSRYRAGLRKYWQHEIQNFERERAAAIDELRKRGEL